MIAVPRTRAIGRQMRKIVFRRCFEAPVNRLVQTRDAVDWRNPEVRPLPRVCVAMQSGRSDVFH